MLDSSDLAALLLTLQVAGLTTGLLLIIATPVAWWLSRTHCRYKQIINAVIALPLVLPPSVLGFYLLILMGPKGTIGSITQQLGLGTLPFTFGGLVAASMLYSLPFVLQPLQNAFAEITAPVLEAAATLRAGPFARFLHVVLPLSKNGIMTASVLGFAHTVGEFGVVLMVGGNIPGRTQVLSVQIYNHVEALEYGQANTLATGLLMFSFGILFVLYSLQKTPLQTQPKS
jgi:molybdate transport system permease protein